MNSLERLLATLGGGPVDRRAFTATLSLYGARLTGCPLGEYFARPEAYVEGQIAVRETFQPDLLFGPFVLTALGEAFGSQVRAMPAQAPNLFHPAARSAREALDLPFPDIDSHPRLLYQREAVRALAARYGGEVPIAGIVAGPMDLAPLIIGVEAWLDALLCDEASARALHDRCCEFTLAWFNALLADGANLLAFPAVFCLPVAIPPRLVQDLALPGMRAVFAETKGPLVMHHGSNRLEPWIQDYADLPNVVAFVLGAQDSMAAARAKLGPGPVLLGNIDGPTLDHLSPEEVLVRATALLEERSEDPRFILSTAAADIPLGASPESIHALRWAVEALAGCQA